MPLNTEAIDDFVAKYGQDITCFAFMGGDSEPTGVQALAEYIHENYPLYRVAWYSGRLRLPHGLMQSDVDYI